MTAVKGNENYKRRNFATLGPLPDSRRVLLFIINEQGISNYYFLCRHLLIISVLS